MEKDLDFFSNIYDPDELLVRLFYFLKESDELRNHDFLTGYGAGTGSLAPQFDLELRDIPEVSDTGIFLIYHEFGLLGVLLFIYSYILNSLKFLLEIYCRRDHRPEAIASITVSIVYLTWFLFKSFTVLRNGFSHELWLGSMGLCCGLIEEWRCRRTRGRDNDIQ